MKLTLSLVVLAFGWTGFSHAEDSVDYNRDVKPILARNCFSCHGLDEGHRSANLRLDERESAIKNRKRGNTIVPHDPLKSTLITRVKERDDAERMPPPEAGERLTNAQINILERWIKQGADYAPHWAFQKPKLPAAPKFEGNSWIRNPIDSFILSGMMKNQLKPNEIADRFILLRRVSLDLRGIPPTPQEVQQFEKDLSQDAYEKMVDRFLQDSAFGERWARMWLDLARYADSAGYGSDPLRPNMWRYRDWVIDSFNQNKPYDQFTIEQLAGDLLPTATLEQKIATAFHRNTMTNTEGGTDDEEFRVAAIKDRTDTTMQVWMGVTAGCAKCHNHKFDPISQKEYYQLYAIFNQTADSDKGDEFPTIPAPTKAQAEALQRIESSLKQLREKLAANDPAFEAELHNIWHAGLRGIKASDRLTIEPGKSSQSGTVRFSRKSPLLGLQVRPLKGNPLPAQSIQLQLGTDQQDTKSPVARFLRIELPGDSTYLMLAEVQAFAGNENIARKGIATQSSTGFEGVPQRAIDGETNGNYYEKNSVTHTAQQKNPWWEVKFAESKPIDRVMIWNRTDGGTGNRLQGAKITLMDDARDIVGQHTISTAPQPSMQWQPSGKVPVNIAETLIQTDKSFLILEKQLQGSSIFTVRLNLPKDDTRTLTDFEISAIVDPKLSQFLTIPAAIRSALLQESTKWNPNQSILIRDYFRTIATSKADLRTQIAKTEAERPAIISIPVMQELTKDKQRKTKLMIKGDFQNLGDLVPATIPGSLGLLPSSGETDRLSLAKWIVHPDNPLTSRVAVNRFWAQLIGKGLVETEEDFGTQGENPSHPELLDWLALEYQRLGWDTKALLRLMVTSSTYRQAAKVTPELLEKDSKNRWYTRAPRYRLEAEIIRDQGLAISGLLSHKLGGPSVFPVQPAGMWQAAFNGQRTWETSKGEDRHRRGIYTFWRRTVPYPSMATFDAPSRETCSIKRVRTNTPLQAFVTMNDPVYVEMSQAFARRIVKEGGSTPSDRIAYALKLALSRPAQAPQIAPLLKLYETELARFQKDAAAAKAMATNPIGPIPTGSTESELAAWTMVCNVILNLDAVLTRN
jgi:hypothetical protein